MHSHRMYRMRQRKGLPAMQSVMGFVESDCIRDAHVRNLATQ